MADGSAGPPAKSLEESIATNPVALPPLLLKRDGLLTTEVRAWCNQGCGFVTALAQELKVVRPNVFDRRPCEAELLRKQLDALKNLGLSRRAPGGGGALEEPGYDADFRELLQNLVHEFLELARQEVELHISSYVQRVERDEPNGGCEEFKGLKARRDVEAREVAKGQLQKLAIARAAKGSSSSSAGPFLLEGLEQVIAKWIESPPQTGQAQAELIPVPQFDVIRGVTSKSSKEFEDFRKDAVAGIKQLRAFVAWREALPGKVQKAQADVDLAKTQKAKAEAAQKQEAKEQGASGQTAKEWAAKQQAAADRLNESVAELEKAEVAHRLLSAAESYFDRNITELVDRTLVFLRVEVLKDVLEANYQPSIETSALRPGQVADALDCLKESLTAICAGLRREDLVQQYCILVFKAPRAMLLTRLLTQSPGDPPSDNPSGLAASPPGDPNGPGPTVETVEKLRAAVDAKKKKKKKVARRSPALPRDYARDR